MYGGADPCLCPGSGLSTTTGAEKRGAVHPVKAAIRHTIPAPDQDDDLRYFVPQNIIITL